MKLAVLMEKTATGYSAHSPDFDGCVAAGKTIEETESLMREALKLHISAMRDAGENIPEARTYATTVAIPD